MTRIKCLCPGVKLPGFYDNPPCPDDVSQEDGLCDHCREMGCPTITSSYEQQRRMRAMWAREQEAKARQ